LRHGIRIRNNNNYYYYYYNYDKSEIPKHAAAAAIATAARIVEVSILTSLDCITLRYDRQDVPFGCGLNLVASPWLDRMPFGRRYSGFGVEQEASLLRFVSNNNSEASQYIIERDDTSTKHRSGPGSKLEIEETNSKRASTN
jgi:hypothetical protein